MKKIISRDMMTSLTTLTFIVISITGIMMYFHILDNFTKDLHEILGLAFVAVAFGHIFVNFKAMKNYFKKRAFIISSVIVLAISAGFIVTSETGKNPKHTAINAVLDSPIEKSFVLFDANTQNIKTKLQNAGIKLQDASSIKEIASLNKVSPFKIVSIISR